MLDAEKAAMAARKELAAFDRESEQARIRNVELGFAFYVAMGEARTRVQLAERNVRIVTESLTGRR